MSFVTYGLIDPRNHRVRYVGQTGDLKRRLLIHNAGDALNPAYHLAREIRRFNLRWEFCIFGIFDERIDAKRLERVLILTLPNLLNSKARQAMLSQSEYPITARDDEMADGILASPPRPIAYAEIIKPNRS